MKEFLSRSGQPFTVRNVDEDEGAYEALVALGLRSVPVTVVESRIVRGFDPDAIRDAITAAGTPGR